VILLSDGFIANGAEPWRLPNLADLPAIAACRPTNAESFQPYDRDARTLARPWAIPGTPGFEHRVGGLEKAEGSGNVSYDPLNHERMVRLRAEKVARVADDIPPLAVEGDDSGEIVVVGWGSTYGAIAGAVAAARRSGIRVGHAHLRHLHPLAPNLGEVLGRFEHVLVPEINTGQLAWVLRATLLRRVEMLNKIQGRPFRESEILERIVDLAGGGRS